MHKEALQFLQKRESSNKETYGFKSGKCSQTIDEDDLMSLIKNIECCNVSNTFQEHLANSIKEIKCSNKIIVPANKTCNLCRVEKKDYKKYLRDNTTKTYQKLTNSKINGVDLDAK